MSSLKETDLVPVSILLTHFLTEAETSYNRSNNNYGLLDHCITSLLSFLFTILTVVESVDDGAQSIDFVHVVGHVEEGIPYHGQELDLVGFVEDDVDFGRRKAKEGDIVGGAAVPSTLQRSLLVAGDLLE